MVRIATKPVTIRFSDDVYQEIEKIAERCRVPVAKAIKMIIDDYLEFGDPESRAQKEIEELNKKLREMELTAGAAIRGTIESQRMTRQIYNDLRALQQEQEKQEKQEVTESD
jgi:predicted DNA-binding protein